MWTEKLWRTSFVWYISFVLHRYELCARAGAARQNATQRQRRSSVAVMRGVNKMAMRDSSILNACVSQRFELSIRTIDLHCMEKTSPAHQLRQVAGERRRYMCSVTHTCAHYSFLTFTYARVWTSAAAVAAVLLILASYNVSVNTIFFYMLSGDKMLFFSFSLFRIVSMCGVSECISVPRSIVIQWILCIAQTLCFLCFGSVCEGIYIEKQWPHAHSITRSWFCVAAAVAFLCNFFFFWYIFVFFCGAFAAKLRENREISDIFGVLYGPCVCMPSNRKLKPSEKAVFFLFG